MPRFSLWPGVVVVGIAACAGTQEPTVFDVGGSNDPVVQMALTSAASDTLTVELTNDTSWELSEGLIAFTVDFRDEKALFAAVSAYATRTSTTAGNGAALAKALNLTVGTDAFVYPAVAANSSQSSAIVVPKNAKLYFIARVTSSADDFVSVLEVDSTSTKSYQIYGFDVDGSGRNTVINGGNDTTGATPRMTLAVKNLSTCNSNTAVKVRTNLLAETFTAGANDSAWPKSIGWEGDFNGDWWTDGTTARMKDPNAPSPTVTGFVKFVQICPQTGSTLSFTADVTTKYASQKSDTTLVVYFFDDKGGLISYAANDPLYTGNERKTALYDVAIPAATRKIGFVPMAYFDRNETGAVFYKGVNADYEPSGYVTSTTLASDNFSSYGHSSYGTRQPSGWAEFGGDWFVDTTYNHATVWNSTWGGDKKGLPPADTGMTKSFSLARFAAGDRLSATAFAAATFVDPTSFVRLRLVFDTGEFLESDRLSGRAYADLDIRRGTVPSKAKSVTVIVNAYLGSAETSSVSIDDLKLTKVR
jgi:hypothetical protein